MKKNTVTQRLNIIKGQINGLSNLIECVKNNRSNKYKF